MTTLQATVVGDYNIIKTIFDFYFDLNEAFKQHGLLKHENKKKLPIKKTSLLLLVNLKKQFIALLQILLKNINFKLNVKNL